MPPAITTMPLRVVIVIDGCVLRVIHDASVAEIDVAALAVHAVRGIVDDAALEPRETHGWLPLASAAAISSDGRQRCVARGVKGRDDRRIDAEQMPAAVDAGRRHRDEHGRRVAFAQLPTSRPSGMTEHDDGNVVGERGRQRFRPEARDPQERIGFAIGEQRFRR